MTFAGNEPEGWTDPGAIRARDIVRDADILRHYRAAGFLYVLMGVETVTEAFKSNGVPHSLIFSPAEIVADLRLAIADLNAAIRSMAPVSSLTSIADDRAARSRAYSTQMADARLAGEFAGIFEPVIEPAEQQRVGIEQRLGAEVRVAGAITPWNVNPGAGDEVLGFFP